MIGRDLARWRPAARAGLAKMMPGGRAGGRRELCRVRKLVCDYFVGEHRTQSTPEFLDRYFPPYAIPA